MKAFDRSIYTCAIAIALTLLFGFHAEAETWKVATKLPADSAEGKVVQRFADLTELYSGGKLSINIYPSEQLGREDAVLEQLQGDVIQIYAESSLFLQKWVPEIKWISAPFLFQDRESWAKFVAGPLAQGWYKMVEDQIGIVPLGDVTDVVRGPYRVIASRKPIEKVDDLNGLKLRMYPDEVANAIWTQLGLETTLLGWTETYQSISSGVVDSVTAPIANIEAAKLYEVAPNIARTNEFWQEIAFMMNKAAFEALSPELRQALLRAHAEAGKYSSEIMEKTATDFLADEKKNKITFTQLDFDALKAKVSDWYRKQEAEGKLPTGFLEAVAAASK